MRSQGFRKPLTILRKIPSFTNCMCKTPFSSDIYQSVPWNLNSQSGEISTVEHYQQQVGISNGSSLRSTPLCFFGIWGLRRGYARPRRLYRLRLHGGNYCGVLLRGGYATLLHKQPPCSQKKKKTAEDGFAEGLRTQQFLKFRFSKGTNVELKLQSTLQPSAGLVVFYTKLENLTLRKNPSCQRLHRNWRFRDRRIFCWKTPCGQCLWVAAVDMKVKVRDLPQSGRSLCVSRCNCLLRSSTQPVESFGICRLWRYQTQSSWVVPSTCLIVLHHP